ncbi:AzlD domain-containing protein [Klugiella xanthotipulae]|uniref:Branched-subunit amino acid transport protein AzlD n=1 Tax=Klugiella xanthotipulae TaxID=244735 RepID=A0A543HSH6_9MICO|nr:AzlD domain-containing protein [Klugiella xanthotipulae]TQM61291.1 hypothetical protein FB466_2237 [Klugiella xanthotipulae]
MTLWHIVLIASALCLTLKVAGYYVPASVVESPGIARSANTLTVGLLAALVAVQTLAVGQNLTLDARFPALLLAGTLYALRVPFIVVVIAAGALAAGGRALLGWA